MASERFRTIGVVGKNNDTQMVETLARLLLFLEGRDVTVVMEEATARILHYAGTSGRLETLAAQVDLIIVVGGDGSLLGVARAISGRDVPILGINRGHLGFLAGVLPNEIPVRLAELLAGEYFEESHFLLRMRVVRAGKLMYESLALNEIVVHSGAMSRMVELDLSIGGEHAYAQRADGLIVTTPTGSTAHALSAGGPIMHPSLDAIAIVPMYPHTLTNRPLVVGGASQIRVIVRVHGPVAPGVSCDGQVHFQIASGDRVEIAKAGSLTLLRVHDHSFYEVCRRKLEWASRLGGAMHEHEA